MQVPEPQFVLNTTTLAAIGGIMGVLTGAISFLTKALLDSKDKQIADLKAIALHTEETTGAERDYWRERAIRWLDEETPSHLNTPAKEEEP